MNRIRANRRQFFSAAAGLAAGAGLTTSANAESPAGAAPMDDRLKRAAALKARLSDYYLKMGEIAHPTNGDEDRYPNKINSFSKTLIHKSNGEVDLAAYRSMRKAVESGSFADFEAMLRGGNVRLKNPSGAYNFQLVGADPSQFAIPAAPRFDSAWQAAEMVELYWQAIARDIPFADYATNPTIALACQELSRLSGYRGPKEDGKVTPNTIFRTAIPGDLTGPYVSQFLVQPFVAGHIEVEQKQKTAIAGADLMREWADYLAIQFGDGKGPSNAFESTARYIYTGRGMANVVHFDSSYSPHISTLWILLSYGANAYAESNPWIWSKGQEPYVNFGAPDSFDFLARAAKPAFNAAWFQKWFIHLRARPEVFGARIYQHKLQNEVYPIHSDVLESLALEANYSKFNTWLLPQSYQGGCPPHSAYPSGHATVNGAIITMLKAFFRGSFVIPNPVTPSADGLSLVPYKGPDLTIEGELNKAAFNIAMGRNFAGIHWRTDAEEGMRLGEQVALNMLSDLASTLQDEFGGFELTKFNGERVTVTARM
ncbi:MAG: vanadium-dependent haloperoxidase [Bryobacteraceae bacterium]